MKEIEALKNALKSANTVWSHFEGESAKWRGIAEKMAHELDYYLRHGIISSDNTDTVDVLALYKEAVKK